MPATSKYITTGVHIWYRNLSVAIWLELGPDKTNAFMSAGTVGLFFLGLLPPPYNVIAVTVAKKKLAVVRNNKGPNGIWLKFGPLGFVTARPRTATNKGKEPNPW